MTWITDVRSIIKRKRRNVITLDQLYQFEKQLGKGHRKNRHVKAKIRQVAQILRDEGLLEFMEPGVYRIIKQ
jgi:predicted transcriptional regulator of viral defense system